MLKSKKNVKKINSKVGKKNKVVTEEFLNEALEKQVSKTYLKKVLENYPTKDDLKNELAKYATKEDLKNELAKYATKEDLKNELTKYATKQDLLDQTERVLTAFESVTVDLHRLVGDIHTTHSHKYEDLDKIVEVLEIKINK